LNYDSAFELYFHTDILYNGCLTPIERAR